MGGRRDELCEEVDELEQQKLALEAEVRSLMQQKQEMKDKGQAGSHAAGPPKGITARRDAVSPSRRNGASPSPERGRKATSPGPAQQLSARKNSTSRTGSGDFDARKEVAPTTLGSPTAPGSGYSAALPVRVEERDAGSRSTYALGGPGNPASPASIGASPAPATVTGSLPMPIAWSMNSSLPTKSGSVAVPPLVGLSSIRTAMPAAGVQGRPVGGSHSVTLPRGSAASMQSTPGTSTQVNTPPSSPRPYGGATSLQPLVASYGALARSQHAPQRPRQATPGTRAAS